MDNADTIKSKLQEKSPKAMGHFDWFAGKLKIYSDKMPKAFAGAFHNPKQMRAIVSQIIVDATNEGKVAEAKSALEVLSTMKYGIFHSNVVDALKGGEVSFDLDRFLKAQDSEMYTYTDALNEIKEGHKRGHWIWYVFPQIKGLGHSYRSEFYGIASTEEAKAYLKHPVLNKRLRDITQAFLDCSNPSAYNILGFPDVLKVQSCMTLFDIVSPNDIYNDVLDKFYEGKRCEKTVRRLGIRDEKNKNAIKVSRLTITNDCNILLSDYQREVKMEPIVKAVYLLFLNHPEGIVFKHLPDYRQELVENYQKIKPLGLTERAIRSI